VRIARGTVSQVRVDNVPLLSGGVAFYAMLALVPALAAAVSLYGLVASASEVDQQIASLTTTLPPAARELVATQLRTITASSPQGLRLSLAFGLVVALWSASSGMRWLLAALTTVSGEVETRRFVRLRGTALLMTFGAIVGLGISLGTLLALPSLLDRVGLGGAARAMVGDLRFPVLAVLMMAALAVLYRFGPNRPTVPDLLERADPPAAAGFSGRRDRAHLSSGPLRWLTWGAIVAAAVWLVGSIGLTLYADTASKFKAAGTYGALGAVVVLLLWLWITSFAVLLGAVVNAQLHRQGATAPD
jgi:membrane protein